MRIIILYSVQILIILLQWHVIVLSKLHCPNCVRIRVQEVQDLVYEYKSIINYYNIIPSVIITLQSTEV